MQKKYILITLLLALLYEHKEILTEPTFKILCTACLLPDQYEYRKELYIKSLSLFKQHGLSVYMVESCQKGPTELDQYCDNICYAQTQIWGISNYGEIEARSIQAALEYFNFDDEDMIIKFTGKYEFQTTEFIDLVNNNFDADVIARMWSYFDAYTVLFAMKVKHLRTFFKTLNYDDMRKGSAFEHILGLYITQLENEGKKIMHWLRVYDYLPTTSGRR